MRKKIPFIFALILLALPISVLSSFAHDTGSGLAGDQACLECHEDLALKSVGNIHARIKSHESRGAQMGCEACHGPGSDHVAQGGGRGVGGMQGGVPGSRCLACHTPEHSLRFEENEESYRERVRCTQAILAGVTEALEPGGGLLEQGPIARQGDELLGVETTGHRPEPGPRSAGENHGNDRRRLQIGHRPHRSGGSRPGVSSVVRPAPFGGETDHHWDLRCRQT